MVGGGVCGGRGGGGGRSGYVRSCTVAAAVRWSNFVSSLKQLIMSHNYHLLTHEVSMRAYMHFPLRV